MAKAARPAHLAHPLGALGVITIALALGVAPARVHAEPAPAGEPTPPTADAPAPAPADEGEPAPAASEAGTDDEAVAADEAGGAEAAAEDPPAEAPPAEASAEAPAAAPASAALGPTAEPLRPMQTAAWWTMFGAFAVGTTAGVLAGLAERQEDRATRLSTLFDAETGAQPLYADQQSEYEGYLRRGEGYAKAAIGVGVVAGVATIAAITLFAIDAKRQRAGATPTKERRAALKLRGGGVEVRF